MYSHVELNPRKNVYSSLKLFSRLFLILEEHIYMQPQYCEVWQENGWPFPRRRISAADAGPFKKSHTDRLSRPENIHFPQPWPHRSTHERSESEQDVLMMWRFMSSDVGLTLLGTNGIPTSSTLCGRWESLRHLVSRDAIKAWGRVKWRLCPIHRHPTSKTKELLPPSFRRLTALHTCFLSVLALTANDCGSNSLSHHWTRWGGGGGGGGTSKSLFDKGGWGAGGGERRKETRKLYFTRIVV